MNDPRIEKIADILVNYSLGLNPGDRVLIQGSTAAAPLIRAIFRHALRVGARPTTYVILPGLEKIFYDEADEDQLRWIPDLVRFVYEEFEAVITIWSDINTRERRHYSPGKRAIQQQAMRPLQEKFRERMAKGEVKWCGTLYPTPAHAQDADMTTEDFENFVFNACLPDPDDPIGFWRRLEAHQNRLIQRLSQYDVIRIVAPDTDISFRIGGRTWVNACGHANFPDGEVFTSPHKTSANGYIRFTYPAIYRGVEVEDVRLWFEKGKVVKATASKGEDFLLSQLENDEGARYLGEFAIGTNPMIQKFMKNTLFDEKMKGTIHLALGMSFPETGGDNQSALHWDMLLDMRYRGKIFGDGELIYEHGDFLFSFEE